VLTPDPLSAMNLGIFYDAVAVAGRADLLATAKLAMTELMRGESAYLARFAKAIDQFEDANAGMLTSLMATVGVGSDVIHIKKAGTFPIVQGVRVLSLDAGVNVVSTAARLDRLAHVKALSESLAGELKSALSYFMELRLRSQLTAMRTGQHEQEAIVRLGELTTRDRDLLREALKVVKRFKEVLRLRYHLGHL